MFLLHHYIDEDVSNARTHSIMEGDKNYIKQRTSQTIKLQINPIPDVNKTFHTHLKNANLRTSFRVPPKTVVTIFFTTDLILLIP